ncbi:sensor histidine kinase [Variovorax sp. KK3]|uniref:sensor histidine kinase n=1 Tax=Variovorax sp. KK3 TaxID=1855728 RepID=UPI00097C72BE|nr:sensor histidine kinase [Variovorax sp. KK3]
MRLSKFIKENIEPILVEWEAFARTMIPPAETMSVVELRDHAHGILLAIADEMETLQTEDQREAKSKGLAPREVAASFAAEHGGLRQRVGFDLTQLGAEYRALRATVLRQWMQNVKVVDRTVLEEVARFNEGIDQGLAEAMVTYSENVANSRDTFLAVLGHDLRNPLSALSACVRMLELTSEMGKKERALSIAKRSITSISEMVTDLLEYTRSRLGRGIDVQPNPGDLAALCHEAFDEVCAAYPERVLRAEIPEQLLCDFDAPRMRQVLSNLLSNAVHHGDAAFPAALIVTSDLEQVTMVVMNRGKPIPPDAMQVIFNPLVQVPAEASEPHERPATSLGLGLYIAREIVGGHRGTIVVTSSAEEGTAFRVRLPLTMAKPKQT